MDLPAQDERMLSAHLETCESCAKFHHQIQQVLLAADDVQLPDDLTPPQPEALARAIMEDLPEQKASPFALFSNMFKGKDKTPKGSQAGMPGGQQQQQQNAVRGKKDTMPPGMEMEQPSSRFPHRTQPQNIPTQAFEDTNPPQMAPPQAKGKPPDDHSGTATRLKAIAKGMSEPLMDSREAQSTTRSLGEKFGMAGPNQLTDDQPLTLAESIRRKIAESQRATGEHEPIDVQDELGPEGSYAQEEEPNWMKPPGLPNRQAVNVPTGLPGQSNPNLSIPSQGIQMPSAQSMPGMPGMPQMPPPMPAPNAMAEGAPQLAGNWGKPTSPQQEASNWGGPAPGGGPTPGGTAPTPSMPAMPGMQKSPTLGGAAAGGAWGDPNWGAEPPKGSNGQDADWGPPPAGGAWDDPNDQPANQFAPPTQAPNFGQTAPAPGMQNPPNMDSPDQPWNKPIQAPQAASPAPAPAAPAWGAPSNGPDWGGAGNAGGWTQPPTPETPAPVAGAPENNPWPAPAGAPGGNAWGGNANGWQQGQPGANQNAVPDSWATPPQQAPAPQAPGVSGQEPAAAAAGAWGTQGSSGSSWGQVAQKSNDSWGAAPAIPPGGGWGQPAQGNAWGGEQANNSEQQQQQQQQQPAPQAAPAAKPAFNAWSVDAEQIETGTWQAFTPGSDKLVSNAPSAPKGWGVTPAAAPAPAPAMPPPPAPGGEQNRWDQPIQDRGAQAPADANRWEQPIQNRGTQEPAMPAAPAPAPAANNPWGVPVPGAAPPLPGASTGFAQGTAPQAPGAPPAPAGVAGTGIPKDSIMDRLSNVLAEGQPPAGQQSEESRWDLPIQERIKQEAMAGGAAAPAQAKAPGDNRWETPIQDRSSQQAPELSPPPPRWDVPIQERTQQLTPTSATPPDQQLAPQPAAPAPWGAPPAPAPAPAAPPAPPPIPFGSPADQGITASSWDLPVVEAQDQLHQSAQPENDIPPQPAFNQPFGGAPQPQGGGSPSRLNINPPAFTPGQPVAQPAPMPTAPAPGAAGGALFNVDDSEIDKIFSEHLGINEGAPAAAAPAKPEGPPQPAIMKSLPVAPPESSGGAWGQSAPQPFGAPPLPGQDSAPQPFASQPAPQMQPFAAPEPQPFNAPVPEPQPFATPTPAPMPFAAQAPEPAPPPQPFGAPPFGAPAPVAMPFAAPAPEPAPLQPFGAPPQPFGAPPPAPFAAPEPPAQPFAPAAAPQPFAVTPAQPPLPGNPFAMPQQSASPSSTQPKIVPVMSKSVATASGGPPASGWGSPSASGGFQAAVPSNGPAPAPATTPVPDNKNNGLFNLDDSAMDDLFSKNLGVQETAKPVGGTGEYPAQQAQPAPFAPQPPTFAPQAQAPAPFAAPAPQAPFGMQPPAPEPFGQQQQAAPQPFAPAPIPQATAPVPFGAPFGIPGQQPQQAPMPFGVPQAAPAAPQQAAPPQNAGLFSVDDNMMNQIFADNLGVQDQDTQVNQGNQPRVNVAAAVQAISEVAVQEPMAAALPPPKIEGLGRLDAKPDAGGDSGSGRIASIGKFLLDQKDLEKIGKLTASDLSDTKMKILTLEAASEIQGLLHHIGGTQGVIGSIIIGHDGLLIANTMPQDIEADSIGIWALAVYMNTETAIKKIGHNRVHQIVARTPRGFLVIADFGGGLLVTLSDGSDTDALIPLMRSITQVVSN
ncbi:MAG: hypothetical protein C0469_01070 [Cyanobacteria bacterium DS2.3.42]|nr:hypothetical protein [Cyanobacteria bacterium DS2.3.42]